MQDDEQKKADGDIFYRDYASPSTSEKTYRREFEYDSAEIEALKSREYTKATRKSRRVKLCLALVAALSVLTGFIGNIFTVATGKADEFTVFLFGIVILLGLFLAFILSRLNKHADEIKTKDVGLFALFSFICAVGVFVTNPAVFLAVAAVALITAFVSAAKYDRTAKKLFIPLIVPVFLLFSYNGWCNIFRVASLDFAAEYFYFSVSPSEQIYLGSDSYLAQDAFSSEVLYDAKIGITQYPITTYSYFCDEFYADDGAYDEEAQKFKSCLGELIKGSGTEYDEEFFSEYIILPVWYSMYCTDATIEISDVSFNLSQGSASCRISRSSSEEADEVQQICLIFIIVPRADAEAQGLINPESFSLNIQSTEYIYRD